MKIDKYIKNTALLSIITCGLGMGLFLYSSSANNVEIEDDEVEVVESSNAVGESNSEGDTVEEGNDVVTNSEGDTVEEGNDVNENDEEEVAEGSGDVNEGNEVGIVEDGVGIGIVEDVEEENVEDKVKALIKADATLPKKVGINAVKEGLYTGIPLLPGFKNENGVYVCDLNNKYQSQVRMYETEEGGVKKVILVVGYEVTEDEQLQGIVKVVLDYYKGKKWEFVYKGINSYFEIKL